MEVALPVPVQPTPSVGVLRWGLVSVSLGPSGTLQVTSLSLLPLHRGRDSHFLFVSLFMLKRLLVHYTSHCSVGHFSWSLTFPFPASDRAWTWFCAWLLAEATLFWLCFIQPRAPPLLPSAQDPITRLCAEKTSPRGRGVAVAFRGTSG